tara:strand:+ start:465 stop:935 length:471 start_codon:yes stop_codon:yes gene_type:complete
MGTRSLTKVITTWEDTDGKKQRQPVTCMYRQYDGYMDGHGKELAEWLDGFTIVNGIPSDRSEPMFNGMDCLAAQMFVHFKSSGCKDDGTPTSNAGGIYCMHPDTNNCFEEYLYEISKGDDCILITVYETHYESDTEEIFHGTPKELLTKIKKEEYA